MYSLPATHRASAMALALVTLLPACAPVPDIGPRLALPPPAATAADQTLAGEADGAWPEARWWAAYGDPQLAALIDEALADSPDIAMATARVAKADAVLDQAGAARQPSLDASAAAGVARQSYNNGIPREFVPQGWNETGRIQAELGFDLDLFGRNRAAYAAARSDAEAARLDRAQAALIVSTNVAEGYAELNRLFAARGVQRDVIRIKNDTARIASDRVAAGLDTQAEVKQAQSDAATARAELAAIDEQIGLARHRLAALLGKGPDRGLTIAAPEVTAGLRAIPEDASTNLIGRRPDIIAARTRVEAEASRIKVARADFYPSVNLGAMFGFQSLGLDLLFKNGSSFGSAGPAVSLPLFRGGALTGRYRAAGAGYDEAVADYHRVVTEAYRQLADALTSRRALATRLAQSQQALDDAAAAAGIARQRFEGRLSRYTDVLVAEERMIAARRTVADLQARIFSLDIALVRALGGGFAPSPVPFIPGKDTDNG